ncbi:MAG TPA: hemolysin family protein [Polyangiales bacterium]|nr:hemolysin family protein [Polyangiales bacterium]
MSPWPWAVIVVLTALNALYVAAEFAAVAVPRSQLAALARLGNRRAVSLALTLQDRASLDRYIAACQIGITFTSLVAGAYAQATIAQSLGPMLERSFALEGLAAHSLAALIVLLVLTALQVVFAELVPKSIALQFPERTAMLTFVPMRWSMSVYRGFIWLLNGSGFLLLRPFGVTPGGEPHVHSPAELELLFAESRRGGILSPEMHRRLRHGLRLSRRTVSQLMVPRSQLIAIDASMAEAEILRKVLESSYTRLPVYQDTIDNLLGTVSTKDIVAAYVKTGAVPPLAELVRPIPCVPAKLSADRLVPFLRQQHTSKAMVVDEFGGVQGMISIDDLLEELFGELGEELKNSEPGAVETLADGRVKLRGSMRPDAAESWLGASCESTAATLSGWIVNRLGRLPDVGERIEVGGAEITVLEVTPTTVVSIAVRPHVPAQSSSEGRGC